MPRHTTALAALCLSALLLVRPGQAAEPAFPRPVNGAEVRASFVLDSRAEEMLRQNGVVVLDGNERRGLHAAYPGERHEDLPLFVTSDALLALWYELSRGLISEAEQRELYPTLSRAVASLHRTGQRLRSREGSGPAARGLRDAVGLLAVGDRLLGGTTPVAPDLRSQVESELARVLAAREVGTYPREDYTQYRVRGHYTQHPALARYFRGSMWLSRSFMPADSPAGTPQDGSLARAVALAEILRADPVARAQLRRVVGTRTFLAGTPNALSLEQVASALEIVHGARWKLDTAASPAGLRSLRRELARRIYPEATVWTRPTAPGTRFPRKVIALLPDAAVPDSRLFQSTMHPAIANRTLPTPLEIAAGLGSEAARREIRASDPRQAEVLHQVDRAKPLVRAGERTLYGGWLEVLQSLQRPDRRAPRYMRSGAWEYKTLNTSLASWTHLRHNSLLYASQAYGGGLGASLTPPQALVEPSPAFYRSLAHLAEHSRIELGSGLSRRSIRNLRSLELECAQFAGFAEAELSGQLKPEQAHAISDFGHWLESFQFQWDPVVVDVATGSTGEVLHAATGHFNPILTMPDPEHGLVYCGWVMSYYETRRKGYERLTDAAWQATLASPSLRPERPGWTAGFLARPGGEEYQAREPLRKADGLFLAKQPAAAVALLRKVVQEQRRSPVSTEAQLRIGQYFLDGHNYLQAVEELSRCDRMYGCPAIAVARELRDSAEEALHADPDPEGWRGRSEKQRKRVRSLLAELRGASSKAENRAQLEERVARSLLQDGGPLPLEEYSRALKQAALLCRRDDLRQILSYAALNARAAIAAVGLEPEETVQACLAYSRSEAPRPLRAGAVALAVEAGLGAEDPTLAVRLLRPFRRPDVYRPHPALTWLRSLRSSGFVLHLDPAEVVKRAVHSVVDRACEQAYFQGDWTRFEALQPDLQSGEGDTVSIATRQLFARFADHQRKPLRRFIETAGLQQREGPRAAMRAFQTLSRQFATSRIAPFALWRAVQCAERAEDPQATEQLCAELIDRFPGTYPATVAQVHLALARWAPETAPLLSERTLSEAEYWRPLEQYLQLPDPGSLQMQLDQVTRSVELVRPVLGPGQDPAEVGRLQFIHDQPTLVKRLDELFPERKPEAYLALLKLDFLWSVAELFLQRYPDHPEAKAAWNRFHSGSLSEHLSWLGPLVDRGTGYRWEREARKALTRLVVRDGLAGENQVAYVSWIREQAAQVRSARPASRSAAVADLAVAEALRRAFRPEDALSQLPEPSLEFHTNDPLVNLRQDLIRTARLEIEAKELPDWSPYWQVLVQGLRVRVSPAGEESRPARPLAASGLLFVPSTVGKDLTGISALEEESGGMRWSTPVPFPTSLAADGEQRLFVGTAEGTVSALDRNGHLLFERLVDPRKSTPIQVVVAGNDVLAWGAGELVCFSGERGELRWRVPFQPIAGRPTVARGQVFLATRDAQVIALDVSTGKAAWIRDFGVPNVGYSLITAPPRLSGDLLGVQVGDRLEFLNAIDGRTRLSLLPDPALGGYEVAASDCEFEFTFPNPVTTHYIRSRNGRVTVDDRPDGILNAGVLYWTDERGLPQASDLRTAARLQWSTRLTGSHSLAAIGRYVYVFSDSGRLLALPRVIASEIEP